MFQGNKAPYILLRSSYLHLASVDLIPFSLSDVCQPTFSALDHKTGYAAYCVNHVQSPASENRNNSRHSLLLSYLVIAIAKELR
jgi:hypothetical protein